MSDYEAPLEFEELPDGGLRVIDNSIQDAVHDLIKRLTDAKEAALKEAIKSLGWIAPEDVAARDRRTSSKVWHEGFCVGERSGARERPLNPWTENPYRDEGDE